MRWIIRIFRVPLDWRFFYGNLSWGRLAIVLEIQAQINKITNFDLAGFHHTMNGRPVQIFQKNIENLAKRQNP